MNCKPILFSGPMVRAILDAAKRCVVHRKGAEVPGAVGPESKEELNMEQIWRSNQPLYDSKTVYSDRLWEWAPDMFNSACREVWGDTGQMFYGREPSKIQRFLSLYFGRDVTLTGIDLGRNAANGNPVWAFYYRDD